MSKNYAMLAALPIETLVSLKEGQQLLGQLIATENLEAEVNQHLDLLDVPETMRDAIRNEAAKKKIQMVSRDSDAQKLFADTESGLNDLPAQSRPRQRLEILVQPSLDSGPHIG